jgi:threonine/homoserine/homoserine lactone efflux protein
MDLVYFIKGIVLGFSVAAPVGPIGVLCIRRTLAHGRASGFATGLGAPAADAMYGVIAGFGLTFVTSTLVEHQLWFRLLGGIFLFYLGINTFLAKPKTSHIASQSRGFYKDFISTFFLTTANPMTILAFVAMFAGLGVGNFAANYTASSLLVLGVVLGSAAWWFILSGGVSLTRHKIDLTTLGWVNKVAGIIIFAFGVLALFSLKWKI